LSNIVSIATGGDHNLALRSDGTVVAWGDNRSGQTNVPPGLSNVVAIAAGGGCFCHPERGFSLDLTVRHSLPAEVPLHFRQRVFAVAGSPGIRFLVIGSHNHADK